METRCCYAFVCLLFLYLGVIFCHDGLSYIEAILVVDRMFHGGYIAVICRELAVNEPSGFNYMGTALPHQSLCHSLYPNLFLSLLFALHHTFHPAVWSRRGTPVYWSIHYLLLIQLLKVRLNRGMKMNWFSQQSSLNEIHRFNLKYCLLLFSQASLPMLLLPPSGEWTGGHTSTPIISAVCKVYDCGWCYCHWNCFGNIGPH